MTQVTRLKHFIHPSPCPKLIFFVHKLFHGNLSETHYDWRKIEPITMKTNFIHFWCVESEFMIKNWFRNWTSELGCIWHIFGKFRLFLENPDIQVTVSITVNKAQFICSQWLLPVLKCLNLGLEKSQIFQKFAKCTLTLISNYEINFLL